MAIVSIKLKAVLGKESKKRIREAHDIFNENVRLFEEFLLLARGKDYYFTDKDGIERYKSVEEVQGELRKFLVNKGIKNVDKCILALASLDSVISEKGSQAAGMLAKLYNADSTAGMNNILKIVEPEPLWVRYFDLNSKTFENEKFKEEADAWIASEEGRKAIEKSLAGSGRPSSFKSAYTNGREWYAPFINDQKNYRKDLENGLSRILFDLNNEQAFPLIHINEQLMLEYPTWVRLMLKTALENYASYIASDETTREAYREACDKFENERNIVMSQFEEQFIRVDSFLNSNYQQTDRTIGLTSRMLRGYDKVAIEWKKCSSYDERIKALNAMQADSKRQMEMGDVNFFRWLAEEENFSFISKGCLEELKKYYECLHDVEMKRKCASYTVADPIDSKRYLFYEAPSGTNYRKYTIGESNGKLCVTLPLLLKNEEGMYYEDNEVITLASSTQMQSVKLIDKNTIFFENDKRVFEPEQGAITKESFKGKLGGVDIRVETNGVGNTDSIFLSFTITVEDKFNPEFKKISDSSLYSFGKSYDGKPDKKNDEVLANKNIRALAIDLGLKQFGACAVGEVNYGDNLVNLPTINFERMFLLKLDGEKVNSHIEQMRDSAMLELAQIKTEIRYISQLKRIFNQDELGRKKILSDCVVFYKQPEKRGIFQYCLDCNDNNEVSNCLCDEYDRMMRIMNARMEEFRSGDITAKQERLYKPGKSFWSIAYLEELRKVIISWNSLSFKIDEQNITMDKKYGVTATRLLKHIQNLKDDRIKIGADSIIQAALGYVYDEVCRCWVKRFDPCNIIVFEDLSRYNFTQDRPAKENSKLMKWAHREIVNETKRQATIYGIAVEDGTDAAYSSKFCYKNSAPGIRCDRITKNDFDSNGVLKSYILDRLPENIKSKELKVGDIIPSEIGSIFATINDCGELFLINADMNAACNLLNRFFGKHTHLLRISTINDNGLLKMKNDSGDGSDNNIGKRERGKYIFKYGTDKLMLVESSKIGRFCLVRKEKNLKSPEVGKDKIYNLFHDPSNIFYPCDQWMGYKSFWDGVENIIINKIANLI